MSKAKESQKQVYLRKIARYEKRNPVASASPAWHTRTSGVIRDYYVSALDTLTRRELVGAYVFEESTRRRPAAMIITKNLGAYSRRCTYAHIETSAALFLPAAGNWQPAAMAFGRVDDGISTFVSVDSKKTLTAGGVEIGIYRAVTFARIRCLGYQDAEIAPVRDCIVAHTYAGGGLIAHGLTVREAVKDLEIKIKKIKKLEAEQAATFERDTPITAALYRRLTGACEFGTRQFLDETGLKATGRKSITAAELVEIFEARGWHDYGAQLFKSRCVFI